MTRLRAWVRNFFGFSRTETNAFLILLPLMIVLIFSEPAYRYWLVRRPADFSKEKSELDSLMATWKWDKPDSASGEVPDEKLFRFNPNTVLHDELITLGFSSSLANRVVNYRDKGGKFLLKKDLLKIYGMDSSYYRKIFPYIGLPEIASTQNAVSKHVNTKKEVPAKFDLNQADTIQLERVYGIGSKLAKRIVAYREKLGGFVASAQLREVYGLDSAVIRELYGKSFIDENFIPRLVNINRATEQELASHPYVKYKLAKAITAYRFQHGKYGAVDDLKRIALIEAPVFQKIKPYLSAKP